MNPNCGYTDKIVSTDDNIQNLIYLSAIVCLRVGRILLKKNSPIYIFENNFFIIINFNKELIFHKVQISSIVCEPQPQTLATLTFPHL